MSKRLTVLFIVSLVISVGEAITFERSFGGSGADLGMSVRQTPDGGYIVAGYSNSGLTSYDFCAVKTDAYGNSQWLKTYGGTELDAANCVELASDGGYVMIGTTGSFGTGTPDFWIVKIDEQGNQSWDKPYGSTSHDEGYFIEKTFDGGYIATGGYRSFDLCLFKLASNGDSSWLYRYGTTDLWEEGYCIRQTPDTGYVVCGYTSSEGAGLCDVWLIRANKYCDIMWRKIYGDTNNEEGKWVERTADGGYIITGYTESFGAQGKDIWLLKTNADGDTEWTKRYGGSQNDEAYCVRPTPDGGYVIIGYTETQGTAGASDVWLLKTNANGDTVWTKTYGSICGDVGYSVQVTTDSGYIICGQLGLNGVDIYLLKTDKNGYIGVEEKENPKSQIPNPKLEIIPSPAISKAIARITADSPLKATLKLYDCAGREISTLFTGILHSRKDVTFSAPPGIYFVRLEEVQPQTERKSISRLNLSRKIIFIQ
ncbi:MAG: hypothetical protein HY769_03315 [Candidatus Stahlbacteria bacterium]|nr:hypothetical protein [Candidatus Stahlbacteria bacterium]